MARDSSSYHLGSFIEQIFDAIVGAFHMIELLVIASADDCAMHVSRRLKVHLQARISRRTSFVAKAAYSVAYLLANVGQTTRVKTIQYLRC